MACGALPEKAQTATRGKAGSDREAAACSQLHLWGWNHCGEIQHADVSAQVQQQVVNKKQELILRHRRA